MRARVGVAGGDPGVPTPPHSRNQPPWATGLRESEDAGRGLSRIAPGAPLLDLRGMRKILISLLVSLSLVIAPAVSQAATTSAKRAGSEQQVLVLLNEIRQQHGLSALTASTSLRNAARFHSADMLQKG